MPGTTDTRIVQMQFDNRNFERNIATSEKSLDKFKNKLDFSKCEKGLASFEKMTRGLSFDVMADNLQKLTDKFTGLGTVSELILSQIRRGIEQTAQKVSHFVNSLGFEQVEAGLEKFAQMNKNVQTIMSATGRSEEEVYKVLGRLNEYTDQTSYNFTDMAANIGKFTSVGIKLEDAEKQMEGIANWAARSGAGITEASRAMYNLSQAMGVGKMTLIDWKSIENAGMATKEFKQQMIAAGLATGTLVSETNKAGETVYKTAKQFGKQMEVNFQNMGSTLSKGWANAEVIQKTLMDYYYEDLYYESEAVLDLTKEQLEKTKKLFEDQKLDMEDWKDLSNMGIMSDEVKQKAIDAAVKMNNLVKETTKDGKTIYKTAAKYGKQIEVSVDTIEKSLSVGWLDQSVARQIGLLENLGKSSYEAAQKCTTLKDVLGAWKDQLSTGWMKAWQQVFGGLSESMEIFSAICNKVGDSFTNLINALNGYDDETGEHITGILESWASVGGRTNLWSLFIGEYDDLYKGAYGILDVIHDVGDMISDAFWDVMSIFVGEDRRGIFKTDPKARNAWIGIQLNNITEAVKNFIASIKNFFSEVPEGATQSRFQSIQDIVKGIFSIFTIGYQVVRDLIGFFIGIGAQLTDSLDSIIELFALFGINLKEAAQSMQQKDGFRQMLSDILEIIRPLTTAFNGFVKSVTGLIKMFIETGKESGSFASFFASVSDVIKRLFSVITRIGTPIINFLTKLMGAFGELYKNGFNEDALKTFAQTVKSAFATMLDSIFSFIPNFSSTIGGLWESIKTFFSSGFSAESFEDVKTRVKGIFDSIRKVIPPGVKNVVKTIIEAVKTKAKEIWANLTGIFSSIKNVVLSGFSSESIDELKTKARSFLAPVIDNIPEGLKERIKTVFSSITEPFKKLFARIKEILGSVKNVFLSGFSRESFDELKTKLKSLFTSIWEKVPDAIKTGAKKIYTPISGAFGKVVAKLKEIFESIKQVFANRFSAESIKNLTDKLSGTFKSLFDGLPQGLKTGAKNTYNAIVKVVKNLWDKIVGFFKNMAGINTDKINVSAMTDVVKNAVDSEPIKAVTEKATSIWGKVMGAFTGGFENIFEKAGSAFDKIKSLFAVSEDSFGYFVLQVIKKLIGLFKINSISELLLAVIGILGIVGIVKAVTGIARTVTSLVSSLEKLSDFIANGFGGGTAAKSKEAIGDKFLKIALALTLVVASVVVLGKMPLEQAKQGLYTVGLILLAFIMAAGIMKKLNEGITYQEAIGAFILLFGIATAVGRLVNVLMPLSHLKNWDQFGFMFGGLLAIVLSIISIIAAIHKGGIKKEDMKGLLFLAIGIALLIYSLSMVKDLDETQLTKMAASLFFLLYALLEFAKQIKQANAGMGDSGMDQMAFLAAAIAVLIFSLRSIADMDEGQLIKMGLSLAGILAIIWLFVKLMGKMSMAGSGMKEIAFLAGGIALLIFAVMPLSKMKPEMITQMILSLAGIMAIIALFMYGTKDLTMSGSGMTQILALAGGIILLILALLPLAFIPTDKLVQGLLGLGTILLLLALFIRSISGESISGAGLAGVMALAVGIGLIIIALIPIAYAPLPHLIKMVSVLAIVFAGLILLMHQMKDMDFKAAGSGAIILLSLAAFILLFAETLRSIKDVNWSVILLFSVGIGLMIILLAQAIKTLEHVKITAALKVIAILAVGIAALIAVVSLLAPMFLGSIGSSLQTLGARLSLAAGMFSDFVAEMKTFTLEDVMEANKKIDAFFELIKSIQDSSLYTTAIHDFGECLLLIGAGISQFWFSVSDVPPPEEMPALRSIKAILALGNDLAKFTIGNAAESFLRLGTGLKLFNNATSGITVTGDIPAIKMAEALVGLKDSLTGFSVGNAPTEIFTLGVGLGLFTSAASGITTDEPIAFKLLKNLADQADNLEKLTQLPLNDFKDQLSGLGGALSIYAEGAQEATGLKIGEDGSGVPDVSGALKLLHALTDGIANDPQGFKIPDMPGKESLEGYGADLAALATALKKFSDSAKDMNPVSNMLALNALSFMEDIQAKLTETAVKKFKVFGDAGVGFATLAGFGLDIAALGTSLYEYNKSVKDFKENDAATDILDFMLKLQDKLTISALFGLKVFDNADVHGGENGVLNRFGVDIAALGESLAAYNKSVADFEENKNAENALEFFRNLKEKLTTDDLQNAFVFNKSGVHKSELSAFGTDISALGEALAGFAENVNFDDDKAEKFDAAIAALDRVQNIGSRLPKIGGLISLFSGHQQTLDDLAGYIKSIGTSFAQMSTDLSGDANKGIKAFDLKLVSEAFGALQSLADIVSTLSIKHVATGSFFNPVDYLADLKTALDFMVEGFNFDKEHSFITSLFSFMDAFRTAANEIGGFTDKDMNIFEAFRKMVTGLNQLINIDPSYDFKKVGENIMAGIEEGMKGKEDALVEAVKQSLTSVLATMNNLTKQDYAIVGAAEAAYDFKPLGRNLATGIAKGIKDGRDTALTEIEQLILDLKEKAYKTADSNSPSLVFAELGGYIAQGLALGVNQKADEPKKAAGDMVKGMIERTDNALASLSYLLANGVDSDPTITPVLDLSNVRSGMAELNKDFENRNLGMDLTGVARIVGNSAVNLTAGQVSANSAPDLTGVYDRMTILGNQIVEMGNQIQKMQIVLDSGALVGNVTNGVDANIGRKTFYATRRN